MTDESHILHPDLLPSIDRGGGVRTIPLVTRSRGATTYLSGVTSFDPGASIALHTHNCLESVMIIEGEASVEIDGSVTLLSVHDTTVVAAGVPHRFRSASTSSRLRILWTYGSLDATRTIVASGHTTRVDEERALS